jgi:hypothetical protein
MNSVSTHQAQPQLTSSSIVSSGQQQQSMSQPMGAAPQTILADQFKGLSIQSQQQQSQTSSSSVTSQATTNQTANNKENSKKTNDIAILGSNGQIGSKLVLKPREFGREITNAATGSTIAGGAGGQISNTNSTKQSSSLVDPSH